jgi:putative transposase
MEEREYFHIFNRGVDKRSIFMDEADAWRFMQSMEEFNTIDPIGSIYEHSFQKKNNQLGHRMSKLVEFVAYRLNQNHYHFILSPLVEKGVQKFMQKLSNGYSKFFNEKYERSGALFQGTYKRIAIKSDEYLLHVSAYVNCNDRVHEGLNEQWLDDRFSSFPHYKGMKGVIQCGTEVILEQFSSCDEYLKFMEQSLIDIVERKHREKAFKKSLIE